MKSDMTLYYILSEEIKVMGKIYDGDTVNLSSRYHKIIMANHFLL